MKPINAKQFIVLELTEDHMNFKMSDNLDLELAAGMLYYALEYLSNIEGLMNSTGSSVLQ